jgi:hypothetical protein
VIGVHTPEFSFEHEIDQVWAVKERNIDYPVALDNGYAIWSAFDNHYWPALYFVDRDGVIRDHHFGEGRYEQSESVIQRLLDVEQPVAEVAIAAEPPETAIGLRARWPWSPRRLALTRSSFGDGSPDRRTPYAASNQARAKWHRAAE